MKKPETSTTYCQCKICGKAHSDRILLLLDDRREYDTIVELRNTALYYGKLMSYYGFDVKSGEWDAKQFSVTKNDKEIIRINSDRFRFNLAVREYNNYIEYLSRKYHIKPFDGTRSGFFVSVRPSHPKFYKARKASSI
jgi:hypothetical protein